MDDAWRTIHNPAIKDTVRFLQTSEETGGTNTLLDFQLAPGGGNPPHVHSTYAEHFEVLEGTLTVLVGRTKRTLQVGESALVPPGQRHRFANPTGDLVRFRVELRPGHVGLEQALRIGYGLARDGKTIGKGIPKSPTHAAVMAELAELSADGLLAWTNPLVRALARRAKAQGVDQDLLRRYCTPPPDPSS